MLGRAGDPNSGARNMPEHFSSRALNLVSQTACTGSQYLPAVGAAKALKSEVSDAVVYVKSREGATSEGEFFELLNWAARESLPLLYVIQNNGYAISVPQRMQTISSVHRIAESFGVHSIEIDGISFEEIYAKVPSLIQDLRAGRGPVLIEAHVVRIDPHSSSDDHRKYRCTEDLENCVGRDPLLYMEKRLLQSGVLTQSDIDRTRQEVKVEVDTAAEWADAQPEPDGRDLMTYIYAQNPPTPLAESPRYISQEPIALIDAINHGLREELEKNPRIVMWGKISPIPRAACSD